MNGKPKAILAAPQKKHEGKSLEEFVLEARSAHAANYDFIQPLAVEESEKKIKYDATVAMNLVLDQGAFLFAAPWWES